jgi:hypothetical protein
MRAKKGLTKEQAQREFLLLVEGLVSDFSPHPEEPEVGVPPRFTSLYPPAKFLRKKTGPLVESLSYGLFQFAWWSVPGSTFIKQINALLLPDTTRVFWAFLEEAEDDENKYFILGTASPEVKDLRFLQLLFAENGKAFDTQTVGYPPPEIISRLPHTPELVDLFISAFNGFPDAWFSLKAHQQGARHLDPKDPEQARELVDQYLGGVLHVMRRRSRS